MEGNQKKPVAAVVGVGPGIGRAAALRFAKGGYSIALLARSAEKLAAVEEEVKKVEGVGDVLSVTADATNAESISAAFDEIFNKLGQVEVLIYNAGAFKFAGILDISPSDFENAWKANCFGALVSAQKVLPKMIENKKGTILLTGATAALRGGAKFSCLSVGKFGLRSLGQSLAREFGPQGIHVAHIIIDGQVDNEYQQKSQPEKPKESFIKAASIAEQYWYLHQQDSTAWTQELDLRSSLEKW